MTLEFQKNLLRYAFQHKNANIEFVLPKVFTVPIEKHIYTMFHAYLKKYKTLPDKKNFIEFVSRFEGMTSELLSSIKSELPWIYEPLKDVAIVEDEILLQTKKRLFKIILLEGMEMAERGVTSEDIADVHRRISNLDMMSKSQLESGRLLLRDMNKFAVERKIIYPTFLEGLNNMTAWGGFGPPELIVLMGPPKSFKTGFLLKIAIEYMRDGLDIFYADFENGEENIFMRAKQGLLECKIDEIKNFNDELQDIRDKLMTLTGAGDMFIKKYLKRQDHYGHVETDLVRLLDKGELDPKMMFVDYINIMGCSEKIKEPRLKIQHNYAMAQSINDRFNMATFTVSKMKQGAIAKEWPTAEDVAEDFEIIYNAHGVFAIMRSEEDIENDIGRIISIVQRQGSSYTKDACYLTIDAKRYIVREEDLRL